MAWLPERKGKFVTFVTYAPTSTHLRREVHMRKLSLLVFLVAFLLPVATLAVDDEWKFFKLNKTTEKDVITIFGPPDSVAIDCSYETLNKAKKSRKTDLLSAYELTYTRFRGDLKILKGPLGEAASTKVLIESGKVTSVDWDYAVKYKRPAEALWKNDKSFGTEVMEALTLGRKSFADGNGLYVTCSTGRDAMCDGIIRVNLNLDPKKK